MGRFSWVFRLALVIGAGALLTTAVVVAVAPRVWRIANAHEEVPTDLPDFEPLAQRTYVYDTEGNEIAVYELENSQPVTLDQVPPEVIEAFLAVEDNEFWVHKGVNMRSLFRATLSNFASDAPQQGASTITMQVVKNDFLAGLERDGRYKLLQMVYAMRLEKQKTKRGDPRALPQHGVLRQQRLRHRRRRRDLLRQAGRRADVRRSGVPRRPGALAVGVRPDQQPRAQPRPFRPGARSSRRRRAAHRVPGDPDRRRLRHPRAGEVDSDPGDEADLLHRGAPRVPPQRVEPARRDVRGALQHAVPRRSADPHDVEPVPATQGRRGPQRVARHRAGHRRRDRVARHQDGRDQGDGRRARLRARPQRGQHGAGAEPDRIEHQDLHPRRGVAGGRRARRHHRRHTGLPAAERQPGRTDLRDHRWRGGRGLHAPRADLPLDQLRVRPLVADRRPLPRRRHDVSDGVVDVPLQGPAGGRSASRSSRTLPSPPVPTR